jgi:hypothetical protein
MRDAIVGGVPEVVIQGVSYMNPERVIEFYTPNRGVGPYSWKIEQITLAQLSNYGTVGLNIVLGARFKDLQEALQTETEGVYPDLEAKRENLQSSLEFLEGLNEMIPLTKFLGNLQ